MFIHILDSDTLTVYKEAAKTDATHKEDLGCIRSDVAHVIPYKTRSRNALIEPLLDVIRAL